MNPSRQKKLKRRYHGPSLSTVNIGLDYSLTGSSINGTQAHVLKKNNSSDDFDLKNGRSSFAHSQNHSYVSAKSRVQSPPVHFRPTSGDSFFAGKFKDQPNELSASKPSWQTMSSSPYAHFPSNQQSAKFQQNTSQVTASRSESLPGQMSKSSPHFYLPGDRVIYTEDSRVPGIPVIYRIEEERKANPDKLNLDRRGLTVCPVLEDEENLRLLNFQHNLIRRIQNLSHLRKLIFLDLYDNHIEEINGLSCLKSLRVLMLGKNRIRQICNLQDLLKLDVLDLHGNKIAKIENVSHLAELRVLNLAGNELTVANNFTGLESLTELNLRRNKISSIHDVIDLPNLQRLFLSHNEIKIYEDISCCASAKSLTELSLDGNPIANETTYKNNIILNITSLKNLDMKKISDEERRLISTMAKKEDEKRREFEKISSLKERRQLAINNAKRQYAALSVKASASEEESQKANVIEIARGSSPSKKSLSGSTDYSVCHLAELDDNRLNFYGPGSLEAVDRNWGEKAASSITVVSFNFILFDSIVPFLSKIKSRFVNIAVLKFDETNICHFNQINSLGILRSLEELVIEESGNPITQFSLWKSYVLYRLSHLSLLKINGCEVTTSDSVHAEKLFGALGHVTTSQLLKSRLISMLAKQKKSGIIQDYSKVDATANSVKREKIANSGDPVARAGLTYQPITVSKQDSEERKQRRKFTSQFMTDTLRRVSLHEEKRKQFEDAWPHVFEEYLQKMLSRMSDVDKYMQLSLEQVKKT